jgi:hypothetical protein
LGSGIVGGVCPGAGAPPLFGAVAIPGVALGASGTPTNGGVNAQTAPLTGEAAAFGVAPAGRVAVPRWPSVGVAARVVVAAAAAVVAGGVAVLPLVGVGSASAALVGGVMLGAIAVAVLAGGVAVGPPGIS